MDYDVIVVGAGPGGYVAAIRCAQLGMKTALIEKEKTLGGTCLNVGCIPSKALLQSTHHVDWLQHASKQHGILLSTDKVAIDLSIMMQRKEQIVRSLTEGVAGLMKKNKITTLEGAAHFVDPHTLEVANKKVTAKNIILATGSVPVELPFLKFDETTVLSSTGALSLKEVPKKMIIVGAGVIGVELASVYRRLGTEIVFIEMLDTICSGMDLGLTKALKTLLEKKGMKFYLQAKVIKGEKTDSGMKLTFEYEGKQQEEEGNVVLVAVGRRPYTEGLELESVGIKTHKGFVSVDAQFRTTLPHVYAIGDLIGGVMLAHKASEEGVAVAEILAGIPPHVHYIAMPNVIYTDPEVASVGLTEEEARAAGIDVVIGTFPFRANPRARCAGDTDGFVKVLGDKKSDRLIGMHILAAQASEMIHEGVIAIEKNMTLTELAQACHAHPTLSEAVKEAALNALQRGVHL